MKYFQSTRSRNSGDSTNIHRYKETDLVFPIFIRQNRIRNRFSVLYLDLGFGGSVIVIAVGIFLFGLCGGFAGSTSGVTLDETGATESTSDSCHNVSAYKCDEWGRNQGMKTGYDIVLLIIHSFISK